MGKKLVIVESPAKAKSINKILGKDYVVKSSMGHVRDLPEKSIGVDIEKGFNPRYVVVKGRKSIISELKKAAASVDAIYLAPDPDREGEAIAWHLKALLESSKDKKSFFRVQYNEITERAVRKAFEQPGDLDMNRVNAQQARRILDRIVGYTVSPFLWRRIRRGLSAGRVQSVALRLVCEREDEIRKFVPEEYWIFGAMVRKLVAPLAPFQIKLLRIDGEKAVISTGDEVQAIKNDLSGRKLRVAEITTKQITKRPAPPHITSSLQQAGSSYCSFSPRRTMAIAQRLYEGVDLGAGPVGLITYMRTDSFTIAQEALDACRDLVKARYGDEYCPEKPNFYKNRGTAQAAHEAIRPTDVSRTPESLTGKLEAAEMKVYRLVWERFVASQMAPAKIDQRAVKVETVLPAENAKQYTFQATASEVTFPGYMKVTGGSARKKNSETDEVEKLPQLTEGEEVECLEWLEERKETQPPPRYSEASLVRALEANGVGRPSTYAQTLSTLHNRKYVTRDKRSLAPTELGMQVSALLVASLADLFDVGFTASMESSLDEIESGSVVWTQMLTDFYTKFEIWMEATKEPPVEKSNVEPILTALREITDWAPEVKMGKRTYSDEKFVASVAKQLAKGEKGITKRQFEALLKIGCRYREQIRELAPLVEKLGYGEMLTDPALGPPRDETDLKLKLLDSVEMDESARGFVDSLRAHVHGRRRLSDAQVNALNSIVTAHSDQIPDFENVRKTLDLTSPDADEDKESAPLLAAMESVRTWKEPVTRGKRVFDDKAFYESLCGHFKKKCFLSLKQRNALKRLVSRYRDQVPGYEELAAKFEIGKRKKKRSS